MDGTKQNTHWRYWQDDQAPTEVGHENTRMAGRQLRRRKDYQKPISRLR